VKKNVRFIKTQRRWTAAELRMLGRLPNGEVARRTGRFLASVRNKRILLGSLNHRIEAARVSEIQEHRFRVKPLECRVLIVAVKSGMSYLSILEILDKIDGEEAFAQAAFPVEDEQQLFLHIFGSSMNSTLATCGPVERSRSGVAGLD
jgi:hypothetical protein